MIGNILVLLVGCHFVGDYWVQTHWQATHKHLPTWTGRRACATHVSTYTAFMGAIVVVVAHSQHLTITPGRLALGLAVSAVTHYAADRRAPLRRLALAAGKDPGWLDGGGLALLDQAWHMGWLMVAGLVMA